MADAEPIRPGHAEWPAAWTTYSKLDSMEDDFRELQAGGVGLASSRASTPEDARQQLAVARKTGMKLHIALGDVTEDAGMIREFGLDPVPAIMIGGVYRGLAVDRHLFSFSAGPQRILIEPPVYSRDFPYTLGSGSVGDAKNAEPVGHYFPEIPPPVRAEVVVPTGPYDGAQHLEFVPAEVVEAPDDAALQADSVDPKFVNLTEVRNRKLHELRFDLTGMDGALLDRVGLAVYWRYDGSPSYWMFRAGESSALAATTREALRQQVRRKLAVWSEANGGEFPSDVVLALRYGDECWNVAGHLNGPAVNLPVWDFCDPAVELFRRRSGGLEHPRTWGYPEIYGRDAYAIWMYLRHLQCAELAGIVRDEAHQLAPGLIVFRNQTRAGIFKLTNDHDGSGQELLTRNLDIVHLDPYPVSSRGYQNNIPRDMSYCAGLSRRYDRPLVPWLQAHTYGYPDLLVHPGPEDIDRMAAQHEVHGPDAIMWLGWGKGLTFPRTNPESWARAVAFHKRLAVAPPAKPVARLAVIRPYDAWAVSGIRGKMIRNPADWLLQQFLEVWAVKHAQPYDVFELPPAALGEDRSSVEAEIAQYELVVSTQPRQGAWVVGEGTEGTELDPADAERVQDDFERQMKSRGWL
jgi:hypothetical protein